MLLHLFTRLNALWSSRKELVFVAGILYTQYTFDLRIPFGAFSDCMQSGYKTFQETL